MDKIYYFLNNSRGEKRKEKREKRPEPLFYLPPLDALTLLSKKSPKLFIAFTDGLS